MSFVIDKAHYNTFLLGPTGVIGIIIFYMAAIYLYRKIDWRNENPLKVFETEEVESGKTYDLHKTLANAHELRINPATFDFRHLSE
jgi:hypothetical protein